MNNSFDSQNYAEAFDTILAYNYNYADALDTCFDTCSPYNFNEESQDNFQSHELISNTPKFLTPTDEQIRKEKPGRGRKLGSKNMKPSLRTECGSHQEYMRKWRAKKNITYEVNFSDLNEIGNKGNNDENKGR